MTIIFIRIRNSNKNSHLGPLFQEKEHLLLNLNTCISKTEENRIKEDLDKVDTKIAVVCSERNKNLTDRYLGHSWA